MTTGRINQISIFAPGPRRAARAQPPPRKGGATARRAAAAAATPRVCTRHTTRIGDVLSKEPSPLGCQTEYLIQVSVRAQREPAAVRLRARTPPHSGLRTSCCGPLAFHLNRARQRGRRRQRYTLERRCFPKAAHVAGLPSIGFKTPRAALAAAGRARSPAGRCY